MNRNNRMICGRNITTPPTPPSIPSTSSERRSPSAISEPIHSPSTPCPDSIQPIGIWANEKIDQKTAKKIASIEIQP